MHHIKQQIKDQIATGDEVIVVFDEDTGARSGKYTIAQILGDAPYELMLVGTDDTDTAGFITSVYID